MESTDTQKGRVTGTGGAHAVHDTSRKLVLNNNWREVLAKARQRHEEERQEEGLM